LYIGTITDILGFSDIIGLIGVIAGRAIVIAAKAVGTSGTSGPAVGDFAISAQTESHVRTRHACSAIVVHVAIAIYNIGGQSAIFYTGLNFCIISVIENIMYTRWKDYRVRRISDVPHAI
jgi:hypothetical protein